MNKLKFWAKTTITDEPGISVYQHMVNVGCVAQSLAELFPYQLEQFCLKADLIGALAASHDIGKITPGFQMKCQAWLDSNEISQISSSFDWAGTMETNHGRASQVILQQFLENRGCQRHTARFLSSILGGHHGKLIYPQESAARALRLQMRSGRISETKSGIDWDKERTANVEAVWSFFNDPELPELADQSPALWWLAGLTSVADWLGSDEHYFSAEGLPTTKHVRQLASEAVNAIGFGKPRITPNLSFEAVFGFSPNEMQRQAMATITTPGVYVIEAPMGMGKTEAALAVAYNLLAAGLATGVYFALPTQATSNRMHLRMQEFLGQIMPDHLQSRLIHGNSWLMDSVSSPAFTATDNNDNEDARRGYDWFASAKRALLVAFGVGTVDQALLAVVAAKHFFVRHFALAGKVVIIDEVHSYDLYTGTLIDILIKTLENLGCTVIILSATLTRKRLEILVGPMPDKHDPLPYPLLTGHTAKQVPLFAATTPPAAKDISIEFRPLNDAETEAIAMVKKGGTVLWICDTVDAAQQQFTRLQSMDLAVPIGLLHSRFPYFRRENLEGEWMERLGKTGETRCACILVSTQIVEQSVDLDADLMITELAPTDMLLQRMGRLWRHQRSVRPANQPRMIIMEESLPFDYFQTASAVAIKDALGKKAWVYDPFVLLCTLSVWRKRRAVCLPADIRELLEATYDFQDEIPKTWDDLLIEMEGRKYAHCQKAAQSSNLWQVALQDIEGCQTRLNEIDTVSLVIITADLTTELVLLDGSHIPKVSKSFNLAKVQAIHKNLVRVPQYCFAIETLPQTGLEDCLHGQQAIGLLRADGRLSVAGLAANNQLSYNPEQGLVFNTHFIKEV